MTIAIQLFPDLFDAETSDLSETTRRFVIIRKSGESGSVALDATRKKDVARSLIAADIDVLITHRISLEAFILLRSYGVRIYKTAQEPVSLRGLIERFEKGRLSEITPENYTTFETERSAASVSVGGRR